ncbi:MAG: hypothetical protein [Microviridae sp.]|nr:MAG: hypothetical protein [Microviridae sp.]
MKKQTEKTKNTHSKIIKQFQNTPPTFKGETNNSPSMTVPDMTLTVKQLLHNHSRGIHSDVSHNEPMYFDHEIPNIDDITDLVAFRNDIKAREKALKAKIKEENDLKILEQQKLFKAEQNALKQQNEKSTATTKGENL